MRGADSKQEAMFSYISPEERVPKNHPLRPIKVVVPIPAALLDVLLSANLTLAVVILLTTLAIRSPQEFSAFPTIRSNHPMMVAATMAVTLAAMVAAAKTAAAVWVGSSSFLVRSIEGHGANLITTVAFVGDGRYRQELTRVRSKPGESLLTCAGGSRNSNKSGAEGGC